MAKCLEATRLQWKHVGPWSLRVEAGQCLGISGPSGVGKSVLLRLLADLVEHEGQATLDGTACSATAAPEWRRKVRYCAATSGWWSDRVSDHFSDLAAARTRAAQIAVSQHLFDAMPNQLSTGERQRLALLRALENRPEFLLLDEPTSALDAETTAAVETLIRAEMEAGLGVVLVSHDGGQLERLAQTVLDMRK